jgi:probable rRNA maturation factor
LQAAVQQGIIVGLAEAARPVAFGLQPVLEVNLILTTDQRIQELNRDYRDQDKPTDVLSFSQIEGGSAFVAAPRGALALGDIIISVETAARQAKGSLLDELRLLAVHGSLHLLGYDHETDDDEARMSALSRQALDASR